ncbi:MAG: hypothetical protein MZV64_68285 [Ignavibacteriales bacterium]|nr:hypothetical protein [Ignavibacteriales bacterium]
MLSEEEFQGFRQLLDIANAGYEVILVEKEPSIGGHMSQLSETFPTLDCSQCILTPRMVEVYQHPKIKLMTYSEVENVEGFIGNFTSYDQKESPQDTMKMNFTRLRACVLQKCPIKESSASEF